MKSQQFGKAIVYVGLVWAFALTACQTSPLAPQATNDESVLQTSSNLYLVAEGEATQALYWTAEGGYMRVQDISKAQHQRIAYPAAYVTMEMLREVSGGKIGVVKPTDEGDDNSGGDGGSP